MPTRVIRCENVAATPAVRYRIEPREQLAAFRSMDAAGEELVAIYHSHPASLAFPSPIDRAEAFYPDATYVLVSLRGGEPELRAYRIAADHPGSEKTVHEVEIWVPPGGSQVPQGVPRVPPGGAGVPAGGSTVT